MIVKFLAIISQEEDLQQIQKMMKASFPKFSLTATSQLDELFDLLSFDGPFDCMILDSSFKDQTPTEII